jgi:transposase
VFITRSDDLRAEQATYLAAACGVEPALTAACALGQDFASMLRERQGQGLDAWIAQAVADDKAELRGFATGLVPDKAAVEARLALPRSTGRREGHSHEDRFQNAPQTPARR